MRVAPAFLLLPDGGSDRCAIRWSPVSSSTCSRISGTTAPSTALRTEAEHRQAAPEWRKRQVQPHALQYVAPPPERRAVRAATSECHLPARAAPGKLVGNIGNILLQLLVGLGRLDQCCGNGGLVASWARPPRLQAVSACRR